MVPDVTGLNVNQATEMLNKHELEVVVSDSNYVKDKTPGTILDLNPAAGQKVKKGRTIYLTINTNKVPLFSVPDVADNSSVRQAQGRILASGFKLTENELISGEKDWVYGVIYNGRELQPGDKVPAGATLTLIVGDGHKPIISDSDSIDIENIEILNESAPLSQKSGNKHEEESWF